MFLNALTVASQNSSLLSIHLLNSNQLQLASYISYKADSQIGLNSIMILKTSHPFLIFLVSMFASLTCGGVMTNMILVVVVDTIIIPLCYYIINIQCDCYYCRKGFGSITLVEKLAVCNLLAI